MKRFKAVPGKGIIASTTSSKQYVRASWDFSKLDNLIVLFEH